MISIQKVGSEILSKHPDSLYIFVGNEYGIKIKYIHILSEYIGTIVEYDTVDIFMQQMKSAQLFPTEDHVYVIRYDSTFIKDLDEGYAEDLLGSDISGVLVLLYEDKKSADKLNKYFPENTVMINPVNSMYLKSYLHADYPSTDEHVIDIVASMTNDYNRAKILCDLLYEIPSEDVYSHSVEYYKDLFYIQDTSANEDAFKRMFAFRNIPGTYHILNTIGYKPDVYYLMQNVLNDIDKVFTYAKSNVPYKQCVSNWTKLDVYNMHECVYDQLKKSRTLSGFDVELSIKYLISLLAYSPIPILVEI